MGRYLQESYDKALREIERLREERVALAAHIERLRAAFAACTESDWSVPVEEAVEESLQLDASEALTRRDAIKKAEALEDMAKGIFDVPLIGECGRWMGVAGLTMQHEAEKYRNQAEEEER